MGSGVGTNVPLMVRALSRAGRWRAESEGFPHLARALDAVLRKLGGTTRKWRFDRMATVCYPSSGQVTLAFAGAAKYYGVQVAICPPRRGNRKGIVEKANHSAAQRWWRTVPDALTVARAGFGIDELAVRMDERRRSVERRQHDGRRVRRRRADARPARCWRSFARSARRQWSPSMSTSAQSRPGCREVTVRPGSARTTCSSSPRAVACEESGEDMHDEFDDQGSVRTKGWPRWCCKRG